MLPGADVATFLDHLGVFVNILASCDRIARAYVLKVKHSPVLVTTVSKSKVDTRAVLGGCPHEVTHDARYVEGQLPLRPLWHLLEGRRSRLGTAAGVDLLHAIYLLLLSWGCSFRRWPPLRFELLLPPGL